MSKKKTKAYYQTRGGVGEEQQYSAPEQLLNKAYEYFEWCMQTPLVKPELMKSGDRKGEWVDVPLGRPFTQEGLCVFCGINQSTLLTLAHDDTFSDAVSHLQTIIRQEQLEGATLGVYNANIISRLQGLTEKQEQPADFNNALIIEVSNEHTKKQLEILQKKLTEKPSKLF